MQAFCECVRAHHVVAQTSNCGAANAYSVVLGTLTGSDCWLQSRRVRCAMQGLQDVRPTRALPMCSHVFPAVPKKFLLRLRPLSSSTRAASPVHAMPAAGQDDWSVYVLASNSSLQLAVHPVTLFASRAAPSGRDDRFRTSPTQRREAATCRCHRVDRWRWAIAAPPACVQ